MKTFSDYMIENLCCPSDRRDKLNVLLADKIKVKEFLQTFIKDEKPFSHIIWSGYDIDEAIKNLKPPCVIKANNAWHRLKFIRHKSDIKHNELVQELAFWQSNKRDSWEWYYKEIKPGFVIEKLMPDNHTMHRIYCFNGKPKLYFNQHFDISKNSVHNVPDNTFYYAETGKLIPVSWDKTKYFHREFDYKLLNEYAKKFAQFPDGVPPFIRIDFYLVDGQPYFSEMTMFPDAASRHRFNPDHLEYEMAKWYEEAIKK